MKTYFDLKDTLSCALGMMLEEHKISSSALENIGRLCLREYIEQKIDEREHEELIDPSLKRSITIADLRFLLVNII